MDKATLQQMQTLAVGWAREAAELSLSRIGRFSASLKADRSVVTETDFAIQERILSAIAGLFPDHGVVAEEDRTKSLRAVDVVRARFTWVIDPLDGTRNYVSGLPCFSTSIAVLEHGTPVVGVIVEHNLGHVFSAIRGEGASLNGQPIRCQDPPAGEDWLIGIPSSKEPLAVQVLREWVARRGYICRSLGSTAFQFALVASSGLTAAFAKRAKIWDLAAGVLIAAEAGALVTGATGCPMVPFDLQAESDLDLPCLAAPPLVHAALLSSIQAAAEQLRGSR